MAVEFLKNHGYFILQRNFRSRTGEIDIIARKESTLVFVEVKYRTTAKCGLPEEAVNTAKQKTICRTAAFYMARYRIPLNMNIRFDVIAILKDNIRHIENAFPYLI